MQMLETEKQQLSEKSASLEEQYLKEIPELKVFGCCEKIQQIK
jgi:hypothetical protein